jgi:hypothetical protein
MELCTRAASTVARPSWIGNGRAHVSLSAHGSKQGTSPPAPASPVWLCRPIPSHQRREAGQGVAEGLAQSLRKRLQSVGWNGAHRGGRAMVRKSAAKWTMAATQTRGCW